MPQNNYTCESYDVTSRGTNSQVRHMLYHACMLSGLTCVCQGNSYDHRVSESGNHGNHYSNKYLCASISTWQTSLK